MKTTILRLDAHDDVISTRDKMGWSKTGRILLVWPEKGRPLTRRLELVLLQRHAAGLGAQLALVTLDPEIHELAIELALPVFKDLRQAQRGLWRPQRGRRPPLHPNLAPPPGPRPDLRHTRSQLRQPDAAWLVKTPLRAAVFILGLLAVLALAAALLPAAELRLIPGTQSQRITLEVRAVPELAGINLSGLLPARPLTAAVEGRRSMAAQGRTTLPDQTASGEVIFTNLTQQTQQVSAGAIVRTTGARPVRFIVQQAGRLPAGIGQQISLPVRAVLPGKTGNLPPNAITAIEGASGLQLTVANPAPTSGGSDRMVPVPTTANRQQLFDALQSELRAGALREIQAQLSPGDLLFTSTLTITQVIDQTYAPAELQPADRLELSLRLEYQAQAVTAADQQALAAALLDASLPEGYAALPDSLRIQQLSQPAANAVQPLTWRAAFTRTVQARIPPARAAGLVLGHTPQTAARLLSAVLPLDAPPAVLLAPRWWPFLPLLPFRISIVSG